MVGVAGRSKGCGTCKKRRVKCDESKPSCHRCAKGGFVCAGYQRQFEFRDASGKPLNSDSQTNADNEQTVTFQNLGLQEFAALRPRSPTPELNLAVKGELGVIPRNASFALSMTNFGMAHHLENVKLDGESYKNRTLSAVATGLSGPHLTSTDGRPEKEGLIAPILLLILYAASNAERSESVSHLLGLTHLLLACGPKSFQRQPLRSIFESCRTPLIIASLIARRRTFLESPDWQTVPWAEEPNSPDPQNKLTNIFTSVPRLLEEDTRADATGYLNLQQHIIEKTLALLERLFAWRWGWALENAGAAHHDTSHSHQASALAFTSTTAAVEVMLYNTILLWLLGLLRKLLSTSAVSHVIQATATQAFEASPVLPHPRPFTPIFSKAEVQASPLLPPGAAVTLCEPAVEIARIFAWLIQKAQSNGLDAKFSALFFLMPIGVAWSALADGANRTDSGEDERSKWRELIRASLKSSKITSGHATGENTFGFGFYAASAGPDSIPGPGEERDGKNRVGNRPGWCEDAAENRGRQTNEKERKGTTLWLSHAKLGSWEVHEEEFKSLSIE